MRRLLFFLCAVILISGKAASQSRDSVRPRISPSLLGRKNISTLLVEIADSAAFADWAIQNRKVVVKHLRGKFFRISNLDHGALDRLKIAGVKTIDDGDRRAKEETILGDFDLSLNGVLAVHSFYPDIKGDDRVLSVKEKPFDVNDLDLRGRVKLNDQFDEPSTAHATFMATIAAGGGNTSPYAKGAAWGSDITTSDFEDLLPDDGVVLRQQGVSVQNHSYGVGIENYYGIESREYDASHIDFPEILHVFSSGNDGEKTPTAGPYTGVAGFANLTGQFKVSKNTIAVGTCDRYGSVVSRSSKGPAFDGRVKPEVIAFGDAGSSEAAAVVSGVSLLLQETYANIYGKLPDAALVKGVLINSARDAGRLHVDFETGFGNVNAVGAIRTIQQGNFRSATVDPDGNVSFQLNVPPGQHELKVTLVWNDPPAEPFVSKALLNDLDLTLRHIGSGAEWKPWVLNHAASVSNLQEIAQRNVDRVNNVEQVTVLSPDAGVYEINVHAFSTTDAQPFVIVFETSSGFEWVYPVANSAIRSNANQIIRWHWNGPVNEGILQYKHPSSISWNTIATVDLSQSNYEWITPDTAALFELRMVVGSENFQSDIFSVSDPDRLKVGFNCDEEVMFLWNKVSSADEYVLYTLGEKYIEPVLTTVDTFAIVQKNQFQTNYFSVAPKFQERVGQRELTIDYTSQGVGCYFIAFVPRSYIVTGSATFDLTIGTNYQVAAILFERVTNDGSFETVQTIATVTSTSFMLTDPSPVPGLQFYRVTLFTTSGLAVHSEEVEIFYVRENDIYIYPNPAKSGDDINIIVSDEDVAQIQLFDLQGRLVKGASDFGSVKIIGTDGLPKGAYVLRINRLGRVSTTKLIIV